MPNLKEKKNYQVALDPEDDELLTELERLEKLSKTELFRRGLRKLGEEHGVWPPHREEAPAARTSTSTPPHAQSA